MELQENPLSPASVVGLSGINFSRPVVAEAKRLNLPAEIGDVALCGGSRVGPSFDRVLFGRKPKCVPAHGVEDVESLHAFVPREDICCRIALGVSDVKPVSRGIRKHVKHVVFGLAGVEYRPKSLIFKPIGLPAGLDFRGRIGHRVRKCP